MSCGDPTKGESVRMVRIVMKFGGSSVADLDRIRRVARRVKAECDDGHQVAVVVSAMAGETNRFSDLCRHLAPLHDVREYDAVVAAGEQVAAGLLAIALQDMGIMARSWAGWQVPIHTDDAHARARITHVSTEKLLPSLLRGEVSVVTGFQGVTPGGRVATLGRGGSDATAVALAAALDADICDIYTDVEGVYTADPRWVPRARKLTRMTYTEMLETASLGAKILQACSVEMALNYGVRLQVRSSFSCSAGTIICREREIMEQDRPRGVVCSQAEAKITLEGIPSRPGAVAGVLRLLSLQSILVDMVVFNGTENSGRGDLAFVVHREDLERAVDILETSHQKIGYRQIKVDSCVTKVSVVRLGSHSRPEPVHALLSALEDQKIALHAITASEAKVSVLVNESYAQQAVRILHTAYQLDATDTDQECNALMRSMT